MKISVIIPVYNVELYLRQCLDSILCQTFQDFELLCVNDGSTDASLSILQEYEKKDNRIKVFTQENKGAAITRNYALEMAQGDYITFLDSDDFYEPDLLEAHYTQITKTNADLCACMGKYYHNDTKTYSPWRCLTKHLTPKKEVFYASDLGKNAFRFTFSGPTNKMIRRDFILKHQLRYQLLQNVEDLYFICMCVALAKITVITHKTLVYYRVGLKSNLQSNTPKSPTDCLKAGTALKKGLTDNNLYPKMKCGFENFMAFEFERYAAKFSPFPEAFKEFATLYTQSVHDIYAISIPSLDAGTLSNLLMSFEGITLNTPIETARLKLIANKQKYAHLYKGHKAQRMLFLYKKLIKIEGLLPATLRVCGYLCYDIKNKMFNR